MSKMFEDTDMMECPICHVSGFDCKLTDSQLFIGYKCYHHKFIFGLATPCIFIMFTRIVFFFLRNKKKIELK